MFNEVQRFLGLVNYLAHFLPEVTGYTSPMADMCRNGRPFVWRALHDKCFESIKALASKAPILKPIDPALNEPIWVISDASIYGVGAVYGQGPEWQTCRPAGFLSRKFTSAQRSYHTYEREALAIMEALLKWEDKLLGRKIHLITDHQALTFFKGVPHPSNRQIRWYEYLSRFDYDISYVEGSKNKVADCLSRYYENDNADEFVPAHHMVDADARLDPNREDLPYTRIVELRAVHTRSQTIAEKRHDREVEAQELATHQVAKPATIVETAVDDITVADALTTGPPLRTTVQRHPDFMKSVKSGYTADPTFRRILEAPSQYPTFAVRDGLIHTKNRQNVEVLCIPRVLLKRRSLTELVIDQAHTMLGHFGPQKTSEYVRRWFWWPRLGKDVDKFCVTCGTCQTAKPRNHLQPGWLHSLPIPTKPWISISMDFVGPFPQVKGYDYLWVVVCRLTSMVHLIPIKTTTTTAELAEVYIREIVRLHGLPESIVSDRDSKFTSKFWREVHRLLGAKLLMSTSFHPQTDGMTERAIRSVSQILRSTVSPDQLNWVDQVPLTEFAINSSTSASTGFAPFELNYGYMPRTMEGMKTESSYIGVREFAQRARHNLEMAHDAIIESRIRQTFQANKLRQEEPEFQPGDMVYLSTQNLALPKGRARKLMPKFIGPYKVADSHPDTSNYTLELPEELRRRRIHPTFHASLLRRHEPNDDALFPGREARSYYDFGNDDQQEWLVDEILSHRWDGRRIEFLVRWTLGDCTWEPYEHCKELSALDEYLTLHGVKTWRALARKN